MRWTMSFLIIGLLGVNGCDRFDAAKPQLFVAGPPVIGNNGVGISSQVVVEEPLFAGLQQLTAGDGVVHLSWTAATDNLDSSDQLFYRVYIATGPGDQDFSTPSGVTLQGDTSLTLAVANGITIYVVVRAVDLDGNEEKNSHEWSVTPNPVIYVNALAVAGGDGLSASTPLTSIGQAVGLGLGMGTAGVNIFVAGSSYLENVFLFPGMGLFGGFDSGFELGSRDSQAFITELSTPFAVDLVTISSGSRLVVIDGFVLSGNNVATTGVLARDARFRISNCEVRNVTIHGIDLASNQLVGDEIRGQVRSCVVRESGGEGITLRGLVNVVLDDNRIEQNTNEGVEAQWIYASAISDSRIEITRSYIADNGEDGIDLDFAEISEVDPGQSAGARVRVLIRGNEIRGNVAVGVQLDLDFENSDGVNYRARIEDNKISANGGPGVSIDGDARARFRLVRNVISANRGVGLRLSGTIAGPLYRISHSRILGNAGGGMVVFDHSTIELRHLLLAQNGGSAIQSELSELTLVNSILRGHDTASSGIQHARFVLMDGEPLGSVVGEAILGGDASLERSPLSVEFITTVNGTTEVPLVAAQSTFPEQWTIGSWLEVRDDGVPRQIVATTQSSLVVDPALDQALVLGDAVFSFGQTSTGEIPSVEEKEGLQAGSLAIDSGDNLEFDRDGTRADLGPNGGNTPGNVGLETALPVESTPVEVVVINPPPSELLATRMVSVQFNRPDNSSFNFPRVWIDGLLTAVATQGSLGMVEVDLTDFVLCGQQVRMSFEPTGSGAGDLLAERVDLNFRVACTEIDVDVVGAEANGSIGTAQLFLESAVAVSGAIGNPGDVDIYAMDLAAGERVTAELIAGRIESPLIGSIRLLDANGVEIDAATAFPPSFLDPRFLQYTASLSERIYIEITAGAGVGGPEYLYQCHIFRAFP